MMYFCEQGSQCRFGLQQLMCGRGEAIYAASG